MDKDGRAAREFLRHTVATLAYRGGKAIWGAPPSFSAFKAGPTTRTPGEILAHVCDLLDWALRFCKGEQRWTDTAPQEWESDSKRFFEALGSLDAYLASEAPLGFPAEKLFQGPVADALTHVGQIALLRRMAGSPVRGENYFKADIEAGLVGPDQPAPRVEFD
jgi:hypothetical protein